MWVGVVGDCVNEGNLSVEKDLGNGGTEGTLESVGGACWEFDALKRPLSRLDFLVRTRFLVEDGLSATSRVLDFSGMLSAPVRVLRLLGSALNDFFLASSSFTELGRSWAGEDDLDGDEIQDFLLNLVSDRTGDMELGDSACLRLSLRLRSGFGSAEGSRPLLLNDRNLDDRRELLGLNCSICSSWGASSESGLDPPDDV